MRRIFLLVMVTVSAIGVVGACGTPPPAPPPSPPAPPGADAVKWSTAVCTGVTNLAGQGFKLAQVDPAGAPAKVKPALLLALAGVETAATTAKGELAKLGGPAVVNAQAVHDGLVKYFGDTAAAFGQAKTQVTALDANKKDFAQKLAAQPPPPTLDPVVALKDFNANAELKKVSGQSAECRKMTEDLQKLAPGGTG